MVSPEIRLELPTGEPMWGALKESHLCRDCTDPLQAGDSLAADLVTK